MFFARGICPAGLSCPYPHVSPTPCEQPAEVMVPALAALPAPTPSDGYRGSEAYYTKLRSLLGLSP